ncbi:RNA polymerase sigma-I factor [Sulfobacillus harzensis]|uniref:RNA polymerase sigma-I factor n=1 Tax=Sulfobacillus harzensis TaxID=2729629 RepID=UPI001FADDB92|nr:RNA polymerase sigma-I factor [Sulfobacillus harzensis]
MTRAKAGDQEARNQLIQDYTPFVMKVASQKTGRFLRPGVDEEISVALLAFNEAITAYDGGRGSFLSFSQTVIQRRLVDYFRRDRSRQHEVALSDFEEDDDRPHEPNPLDRLAQSTWTLVEEQEARRQEIVEYQAILARYDIAFSDLVKVAPKHRDSRDRAIQLARAVARDPVRAGALRERGELPVKALVEEFGVSRKLIERNRKYIVAVALILMHDFPHLQGYVLDRG